jgi:hypothetical protein
MYTARKGQHSVQYTCQLSCLKPEIYSVTMEFQFTIQFPSLQIREGRHDEVNMNVNANETDESEATKDNKVSPIILSFHLLLLNRFVLYLTLVIVHLSIH